jgi:hypothetical protein
MELICNKVGISAMIDRNETFGHGYGDHYRRIKIDL